MTSLKKGCLGTFDSLDGSIPVRVTKITGRSGPAGQQEVTLQVTVDAGPYKAGNELQVPALWVKPNGAKTNDYYVECST